MAQRNNPNYVGESQIPNREAGETLTDWTLRAMQALCPHIMQRGANVHELNVCAVAITQQLFSQDAAEMATAIELLDPFQAFDKKFF